LFQQQLAEKNTILEITDNCYEWLAKKGFSKLFGAREVARLIQDKIKTWFVDEVLFGSLVNGGKVIADIENDDVVMKVTENPKPSKHSSSRKRKEPALAS